MFLVILEVKIVTYREEKCFELVMVRKEKMRKGREWMKKRNGKRSGFVI